MILIDDEFTASGILQYSYRLLLYVYQMVQATHYIDGSLIYGSNDEVAANLRSYRNGLLKSEYFENSGQEFCPQTNRTSQKCGSSKRSNVCYFSGINVK